MFNSFQGFLDGPVDLDFSYSNSISTDNNRLATLKSFVPNELEQDDSDTTMMFEDKYLHLPQQEDELSFNDTNNRNFQETNQFGTTGSSIRLKTETLTSARRAAESKKSSKEMNDELDLKELRQTPQISQISKEIVKNSRPKGYNFQYYSQEWLKLRDAKIEQARRLKEEKETYVPRRESAERYLPKDYKGPISGYYDQVGKYFGNKMHQQNLKQDKDQIVGRPQINQDLATDLSEPVEERLLRKGKEYKSNRAQIAHTIISNETKSGPQYQPNLVSRQQLRDSEYNKYETLYMSGIQGMVSKQQKIVMQQQEELKSRIPKISAKSREMAKGRTFADLHKPKEIKEESIPQGRLISKQELDGFLKRNYNQQLDLKDNRQLKIKEQMELEIKQARDKATPALCEQSVMILRDNQRPFGASATFEELYKAAALLRETRLSKELKRKQELEKKEMEAATFKPLLHKPSQAVFEPAPQVIVKQKQDLSYGELFKKKKQSQATDPLNNVSAILVVDDESNLINSMLGQQKNRATFDDTGVIQNFFSELTQNGSQMDKIIEEAKKAIFDFDQNSKPIKEDKVIGLVTPPAKDVKKSPPIISASKLDGSFDGTKNQTQAANSQQKPKEMTETQKIRTYYNQEQTPQSQSSEEISPYQKKQRRQEQKNIQISPLQHMTDKAEERVRDLDFDGVDGQVRFQEMIDMANISQLDKSRESDNINIDRFTPEQQPRIQNVVQPLVIDSRVNHTLSQIDETYDEDDISALNQHTPNTARKNRTAGSLGDVSPLSMKSNNDVTRPPRVLQEIEEMELEFNTFLEQIYNN